MRFATFWNWSVILEVLTYEDMKKEERGKIRSLTTVALLKKIMLIMIRHGRIGECSPHVSCHWLIVISVGKYQDMWGVKNPMSTNSQNPPGFWVWRFVSVHFSRPFFFPARIALFFPQVVLCVFRLFLRLFPWRILSLSFLQHLSFDNEKGLRSIH